MPEPAWIPDYKKPDAPGIAMNFDNTVALYQIVQATDDFAHAANHALSLIQEAQERYPEWPRVFYVDILGHQGERDGFDEDFFEFQQEFWFSTIAHFVTAFEMPLTGALVNPQPQRNDLPDSIVIQSGN